MGTKAENVHGDVHGDVNLCLDTCFRGWLLGLSVDVTIVLLSVFSIWRLNGVELSHFRFYLATWLWNGAGCCFFASIFSFACF